MVLWEGAIHALRQAEAGLVSPVYAVWEVLEDAADWQFVDYLVRTPVLLREYERLASGVVKRRRTVRKAAFLDIAVKLPPRPEQSAIARVLRTVERAIEQTDQVIAAAKELKRSLMHHVFTRGPRFDFRDETKQETEFGEVPSHWKIRHLEECAYIQTGVAKGRRLGTSDVIEVPYLRVANVQHGFLDLREIKTIAIRPTEFARYRLEPGDVLLTEGGDFDKLGRGHLWRGEIRECVHQNHIFAVRADRSKLIPEYLSYLIQSSYARKYFLKVAHRTTHLASINKTKVASFPALVPPLGEQREIARLVAAVDKKIAGEEIRREALGAVFRSLTDKVMSAQLRVAERPADFVR
jgi:type I restriction enzyme S subunit